MGVCFGVKAVKRSARTPEPRCEFDCLCMYAGCFAELLRRLRFALTRPPLAMESIQNRPQQRCRRPPPPRCSPSHHSHSNEQFCRAVHDPRTCCRSCARSSSTKTTHNAACTLASYAASTAASCPWARLRPAGILSCTARSIARLHQRCRQSAQQCRAPVLQARWARSQCVSRLRAAARVKREQQHQTRKHLLIVPSSGCAQRRSPATRNRITCNTAALKRPVLALTPGGDGVGQRTIKVDNCTAADWLRAR
jgi:hypothetical protein